MGVSFHVVGIDPDYESGRGYADLSNANAREVLGLLGYEGPYLCGTANCRAFVRACDAALRRVAASGDGVRLGSVSGGHGHVVVVEFSREAGYLARRIGDLRALAATGGDLGTIAWG